MGQQLQYLKDFMGMTESEQNASIICQGNISFMRLFHYIYGERRTPTEDELKSFRRAYRQASTTFTRCQTDLMHAEFGTSKVPFRKATLSTDALLSEPLSSNVRKLKEAIKAVENCYDDGYSS